MRGTGNTATRRVLVSAGSKHGATAHIADRIGDILAARGLEVTVARPEQVDRVEGYHTVVLGSAVYAGRWQKEARDLAGRVAVCDPRPEVWLFSSGPVGDPPKPEEDPVDVAEIVAATEARQHRVFAGRIDRSVLGFGERAILTALRAPEGDFRDWEEIGEWAERIADDIQAVR